MGFLKWKRNGLQAILNI